MAINPQTLLVGRLLIKEKINYRCNKINELIIKDLRCMSTLCHPLTLSLSNSFYLSLSVFPLYIDRHLSVGTNRNQNESI